MRAVLTYWVFKSIGKLCEVSESIEKDKNAELMFVLSATHRLVET